MLIYAYPDTESLPEPRRLAYKWQRYCRRYGVTVRIETPTGTLTFTSTESTEAENDR